MDRGRRRVRDSPRGAAEGRMAASICRARAVKRSPYLFLFVIFHKVSEHAMLLFRLDLRELQHKHRSRKGIASGPMVCLPTGSWFSSSFLSPSREDTKLFGVSMQCSTGVRAVMYLYEKAVFPCIWESGTLRKDVHVDW